MILIGIAVLIVMVLVGVAIYYQTLLHSKKQREKEAEQEFETLLEDRQKSNAESIIILARATLAEQVNITEASIRINALLPYVNIDDELRKDLSVFQQLAEATSHIPILERWKALSKQEKRDFDAEREVIENKFEDFVMAASKRIVENGLVK